MTIFSRIRAYFRTSKNIETSNEDTGAEGEKAAARFLKQHRFKILVPRYRCRFGEIDLVAREGKTLVFVEVKTRESSEYGEPALAVDSEKQMHISRVALDYLRRLKNPEIPVRFDIVEVTRDKDHFQCNHIRDAFPLSEPYLY
jgi:putative endonuclease